MTPEQIREMQEHVTHAAALRELRSILRDIRRITTNTSRLPSDMASSLAQIRTLTTTAISLSGGIREEDYR